MGAMVPELDQRVITGLLATHLPRAKGRRLMLVHGRYAETAAGDFTVPTGEGERRKVRVTHATSVLGITHAWQKHLAEHSHDFLVITTDVADERIGVDLLGEMMRLRTITVDEADIVKQLFGAADLDPRLRRDPWLWLPAALIAAEPQDGGWPHRGTVLTLDAAMRALVGVRLGLEGVFEGGASVDVDALLAWSQQPGGPERFAELPEAEQQGIADWLEQRAGEAAPLLLRLAVSGLGPRATALGLLSSVLSEGGDPASADATLALGSLLNGVRFRPSELRAFTSAVEGTLTRWIGEAAGRGAHGEQARHRVLDVVRQADELAESVHLTDVLADNPFLPSGFQARLRRLAGALSESADSAQAAWEYVRDHHLAASFYPERVELARMVVRLRRWLDQDMPEVSSVGQAVRAHVTDWGWVDRALAQLRRGDTVTDPTVDRAYQKLHEAAHRRRHLLDEAFAACLGQWAQDAHPDQPGGNLLVENVLHQVALPLADAGHAPLVVVLAGMTSAVAAELGEELTWTGRWVELGEGGLRGAAVTLMPSVTAVCRTSLLSGHPVLGGPEEEKENFAVFWQHHQDTTASLFHESDIPGDAGHRLHDRVVSAIASDDVIGVVLDTIGESLDHSRQSSGARWTVDSVTYLPELLNAARAQGRPVVLASAHGHVLDRDSAADAPMTADGVEAARWRTGAAGEGEVTLDGPRVLEHGGRITAAWSEEIHYTPRKAGYRGGAALAEMAAPVLVLAPTDEVAPEGWTTVPRESVEPWWWEGATEPAPPFVPAPEPKPKKEKTARKAASRPKPAPTSDAPVSDDTAEAPTPPPPPAQASPEPSLGWRVVSTKIYDHQKTFVRRAPDRKVVAAVVDALDAAGGTLSLAAVVAAVIASGGRAPSRPEGIVTMLTRLLNVEGYDVINLIDARTRVRLNRDQLLQQFELTQAEGGEA